ncbi:MAG: serine/threonine protein kinase [Oscillospiraceae bacterium]|jgi:serine/threonine-protein kinase|nr:serine/threonine protein kinase [Oscillospiraceae bacterium]
MLKIGSYVDGKYKILNEISRGGMSIVYMAVNEKLNKTWAIKVAQRNGVHDNNTAIMSLAADKKTLTGLRHPNLPSIVDVYENERSMMLVMDYIEGNPLSKTLEEYGAQPQEDVIRWAKQLCGVLGYLHGENIIYRDMKPSNIIRKPDGDIMLVDFGAAREFKEENVADTQCLGTIGYAAPEQFGGHGQTDARTDIYCLGATLHHLITGIDPCKETSFTKAPIRRSDASLSGGLERIIEKCLRDDKRERYQSCAELMYALERYEEYDDRYRKKQKRRLAAFFTAAAMAVGFASVSGLAYAAAENRLSADYGLKVAAASDAQLPQERRVELYLDAVRLDPAGSAAYLNMLEAFVSGGDSAGRLTREEASVLTQLKAGLDVRDDRGYSSTIYPLEALKSGNPAAYREICYEIGTAFWYDYEAEADRFSAAAEWFKEASSDYPTAGIYVDIGRYRQEIKKYAGQNRTEKMYEAYASLWESLAALRAGASEIDDNDIKLLAWAEIVSVASDKAGYFLVNVDKAEMLALLDDVAADAGRLGNETKYEDVKAIIKGLSAEIGEAKARINSAG